MTGSHHRCIDDYVDLEEELPSHECSNCGWLHEKERAWGMTEPNDDLTCPECGALSHSKEVRNPDHGHRFTIFPNRQVRI